MLSLCIYRDDGVELVCMEGPEEGSLAGWCQAGGIMKFFKLYDTSSLLIEGNIAKINPDWKNSHLDIGTKCIFTRIELQWLLAKDTQETPAVQDTTCSECYGTGFYHGIGAPCDCIGVVTAATATTAYEVGMHVLISRGPSNPGDWASFKGVITEIEGNWLEGKEIKDGAIWAIYGKDPAINVEILP